MNAQLGIPLTSPIDSHTADELLLRLWGSANQAEEDARCIQSYFNCNYASQCQKFLLGGGRHVPVSTHADVIEIVSQIQQDKERPDLHRDISQGLRGGVSNANNSIDGSLNLCSRLLTMTSIGEPPLEAGVRLQPDIKPQTSRIFTAISQLVGDDKTVSIFDCVAFLRFQRNVHRQMFPPGFIDETLRTLSLLIPQNDTKTQEWIESQIEDHDLDPLLTECGSLSTQERRFENFNYWNNRLVILKQALDESRPQTLAEGALQVYLSWKALDRGG
ncbi:hypothetical protein GGR55DRAFT_685580 [Xylaria sp. FL0064]|nr:hypothetical protein GGR55DRAFT_685580 [Xylaria sp. FL0064]